MKQETSFVRASQIAVRRVMKVIDRVKQQLLDSYAQQGNFRRIVGKNYEDLTAMELQRLATIYTQPDGKIDPRFLRWVATNEIKKFKKEGR